VVGLIKDYKHSGKTSEWRDFANYITIFLPQMNAYTQYSHFSYEGHLVQLNDFVKSGDPLTISGNTGWTSAPHLHFNVLVPARSGLQSIPCRFKTGLDGIELSAGDTVEH
jgi:murein DD-endopeptidase MepM/ murein hydrolase activator NlpD